jgi:TFIIF-interacting CTD phosphatase-like protein
MSKYGINIVSSNDNTTNRISKKNLYLDMDECIIHSQTHESQTDGIAVSKAMSMMQPTNVALRRHFFMITLTMDAEEDGEEAYDVIVWGTKRPYLDDFLCFADRYFDKIIVWSAGSNDYVHKMTTVLFKDHRWPDMILTRDHVIDVDIEKNDYYKPMAVVNDIQPGFVDLKLSFFVDDKKDNFRMNPDHGIVIPRFEPDPDDSFTTPDDYLLRLIDWLMTDEVISSTDVTTLDKSRIFKKRATKKHTHLTTFRNKFVFAPIKSPDIW